MIPVCEGILTGKSYHLESLCQVACSIAPIVRVRMRYAKKLICRNLLPGTFIRRLPTGWHRQSSQRYAEFALNPGIQAGQLYEH